MNTVHKANIIQTSNDTFRGLREENSYYVDKTEMIYEYLNKKFEKAVLFARPRRFGKTLTMTMLRDFLDIRQDSKGIFEGLKIMSHSKTVEKHMNQYPVLFLSLKEVFGTDFNAIYGNLRFVIAELCKSLEYILQSDKVDEDDKIIFRELKQQNASEINTTAALNVLARMLRTHYQKPVFIIIDEYDVPMAKALNTPAYDQTRDMIEHMLSYVCKTNENVKAVILSGCFYTVKNSTYTGVNNIIPYTVLNPNYASYIGFTDDDVKQLLSDVGLADRYDTVSEWYDGYVFGREKMYCPWDVLRYVSSVLDGSYSVEMGPESYWVNTSSTSLELIHGFLGKATSTASAATGRTENAENAGEADSAGISGFSMTESFEQLLAGKTIDCKINETLTYHNIHSNGDNIWSALLETGYLTKAVTGRMPLMPLRIPNKSIADVFRQEVWDFFSDKVDNVFVRNLSNALWAGEIETAEKTLNLILESTLSFYHAYQEYSYHLILDGFFTGLGYRVESERESGYGRSDLMIKDPARTRALLLELKHTESETEMNKWLQEAVGQIVKMKYESKLKYEGYETIIRYGMTFHDKKAIIERLPLAPFSFVNMVACRHILI